MKGWALVVLWILSVVLALAVQQVVIGASIRKTGVAPVQRFHAVDAVDYQCTDSVRPAFVDMPGMQQTVRLGGTRADELLVLFQGSLVDSRTFIRLVIDDAPASGPGDFLVIGWGGEQTNGFNFISDPLAPGRHHVKIQWATQDSARACVRDRSMVVLHR